MNLIINSTPKLEQSVGLSLARNMADFLTGDAQEIRVYDDPEYFCFQFQQDWIDAFKMSERVIIPVAMWNYGIPAALKDFFDKIMKKGELWDFEEGAYKGLLQDRPAYIIMTSAFSYEPGHQHDFVVPYIQAVLGAMGIHSVKAFRVGGVINSRLMSDDKDFMDKTFEELKTSFVLI